MKVTKLEIKIRIIIYCFFYNKHYRLLSSFVNYKRYCNHTFCNSQNISIVCSVCDKRNNRAGTGIFCRNCNSVVHKKCSRLKQAELLELKSKKVSFLWECSTCMKDKFPFHSLDNMDIVSGSFNSNFSCKCRKTANFVLGSENYIFNYKVDSEKTDCEKTYSDMMTDSFILQPKFKFYQTYEFDKFVNTLSECKAFSVFHANICSLQANFESLLNLINNLDHQFSVVAMSETWIP